MKKISTIALLAAVLLVAGILTAGCTQDAGSSPGPAGNSQQVAPASGDTNPPAVPAGNANGNYGNGRQFGGQNFLTNQTLLNDAAGKLGISEQDLQNALTSTANTTTGRPNLNAAAQNLGITQQQLMDALGFPAGGFQGQNFLTNQTLLNDAAGKLGISEQDLQNALTSTTNATTGRPNLNATAQKLGITQQQLTDALGIPAGGFRGRGYQAAVPAPTQ